MYTPNRDANGKLISIHKMDEMTKQAQGMRSLVMKRIKTFATFSVGLHCMPKIGQMSLNYQKVMSITSAIKIAFSIIASRTDLYFGQTGL